MRASMASSIDVLRVRAGRNEKRPARPGRPLRFTVSALLAPLRQRDHLLLEAGALRVDARAEGVERLLREVVAERLAGGCGLQDLRVDRDLDRPVERGLVHDSDP